MAAKYCFGIDVGGTTVKMGFFQVDGTLIDKWEIPTRKEDNGKNILPDIAKSILDKLSEKSIEKDEVSGIGIGVPGPVEKESLVHKAVNLNWGEVDLKKELGNLTGLPVKGGNDANVAALGEMWKGGGQGYNSIVMITLGTGVGGGIIIDGKILSGATGAGGEIGHMYMGEDTDTPCGCGNHGCFEQFASATGIVRIANDILDSTNAPSTLRDGDVTSKDIFQKGIDGKDPIAQIIIEEYCDYLGRGMAMLASVLNPEAFVIGGGVSKAGQVIIDYASESYQKHVFHGSKDTKVLLATLGNDAGIYGAAKLIIE